MTFTLLSTSDTDLLSARASGAGWQLGNPARLGADGMAALTEGSELVVVRILGVRRQYEGLIELLRRHSEGHKADTLSALCARLCVAPHSSSAAWEWAPAHGALGDGLQALALIYWLSDAKEAVRAPMPIASSGRTQRDAKLAPTASAAQEVWC